MAFEKFKRNTGPVEPVEETKTSNRRRFVQAFYIVIFLWFIVACFALGAIWAPPTLYGLAGNFTATAWLLGVPLAFSSLLLLFCAEEFMDVE
jgi:hypothetical protein